MFHPAKLQRESPASPARAKWLAAVPSLLSMEMKPGPREADERLPGASSRKSIRVAVPPPLGSNHGTSDSASVESPERARLRSRTQSLSGPNWGCLGSGVALGEA